MLRWEDMRTLRLFPLGSLFLGLFFLVGPVRAANAVAPARDVLVYPDGDRVRGRLVERTADTVVFQSDRFGLLRVPAAGTRVIRAGKPAGPAAAPAAAAVTPAGASAKNAAEAAATGSLARLAAKLQAGFEPWAGRLAFSAEAVTDSADRTNLSAELQLKRKWETNEVQLKGRYDFNQTDGKTTTDLMKADGLVRHDFPHAGFLLYRPGLEWSRAGFRSGVPSDYVLLQQEIGAGISLLTTPRAKVRTGVSENLFDVWSIVPGDAHNSRTAESAFVENEVKLPWGMLLTERGVYYYSIATEDDGWENRVELTKKFTKTLSTAIRHELRRDSPDGRAQDYTRLKLLFGVDF